MNRLIAFSDLWSAKWIAHHFLRAGVSGCKGAYIKSHKSGKQCVAIVRPCKPIRRAKTNRAPSEVLMRTSLIQWIQSRMIDSASNPKGECRKRRAAAINSPLSAHRSFYGCNLAAFIRADTSRIIYTRARLPRVYDVRRRNTVSHAPLREVSNKLRYEEARDLGVALARVLRRWGPLRERHTQLVPGMRPSFTVSRLHLPLAAESTSSFSFVLSHDDDDDDGDVSAIKVCGRIPRYVLFTCQHVSGIYIVRGAAHFERLSSR